jgi:putative FmdB family regulatory protein
MPAYQYRCERDGVVELRRPMGAAPATHPCPVCDGEAVRVFSAPMVAFGSKSARTALDRADRTRDHPGVVTALPPRPAGPRPPATPAQRRLPKP